jgi:hypothetical protein
MVSVDFMADWHNLLAREISAIDPAYASGSAEQLCHRWLNWRLRSIPARPRRIREAREFMCPPARQGAFTQLRRKIRQGDDVAPHLSKGILKLDSNDALLNDWGIYHLHLGTALEKPPSPFVERTREVLFARFDDDNAYLISVGVHGDWAQKRLLEVVHRNWPQTITHARLPAGVKPAYDFTDDDRTKIRKAHVQAIEEVDGVTYMAPGGGVMTSGLSSDVVAAGDRLVYSIRWWQRWVEDHEEMIRGALDNYGIRAPEPLRLRMDTDWETVFVVEDSSGARVNLSSLLPQKS